MITIFHGINTPASRKAFIDSKQKAANPVLLEGAKITVSDLTQLLEGTALFAQKQQIFIDEFFSKRKAGNETDAIIAYISSHEKDNEIVIWESKEITPKQTKAFKARITKFDLPRHMFAFLDSILPNHAVSAIELFHKTLETEDAEFVFFMLIRHIRILLALTSSTNSPIEEVKRLAPWQRGKLEKQAHHLTTEFLQEFYNHLFTIEVGLKTGTTKQTTVEAIDFLLSTL